MASVRPTCATAAELFESLVQDVLEATCTAQDKVLAAKKLVQFTVHPEINPLTVPLPPEPPEEIPEPEPPADKGVLARQFGLN